MVTTSHDFSGGWSAYRHDEGLIGIRSPDGRYEYVSAYTRDDANRFLYKFFDALLKDAETRTT